ncbi:MAG: CHAT domain-containing protein [Acidobacteria bacterium]|nr:CHAT domain-containing protein [Acidobacteriota bacterium]
MVVSGVKLHAGVYLVGAILFLSGLLSVLPEGLVQEQPSPSSSGENPSSRVFQIPRPGEILEQKLNGGESHTYHFTANADEYVKLVVEQKGIDVIVRLSDSSGTLLREVDSPNGNAGPEPLSFVLARAGIYRLEIASVEKVSSAGTYELNIKLLRAATAENLVESEVETLLEKAGKLRQAGKFTESMALASQAVEKSEQTFGADHPLVADSLFTQARIFQAQGNYPQTEAAFQRALAIREKVVGPESLEVARCLSDLGNLYRTKGEFSKAEDLLVRSLTIKKTLCGNDHTEVANSLNNLGVLYYNKGDYLAAESLYLQAVAIWEKIGSQYSDLAATLNNLGALYYSQSDYPKAEPLYQRSLAIREKVFGEIHLAVAESLNNLAGVYRNRGDYAQAEPLLQRALAIREKMLGPNHPDLANNLNNLAAVYRDQGNFAKAEPLYQQALAIREKVLGPHHPDVATSLNNLGALYLVKGDVTKAEEFHQRALAIREKVFGADHPMVATSLSNLAMVNWARGTFSRARELYERALAIRAKVFGDHHPTLALNFNNLAGIYQAQDQIALALAAQIRTNELTEQDFLLNLVTGSERQKLLYLKKTAHHTDDTLSLNINHAPTDPEALRAAFMIILRRKGRALDAMANSIEVLRRRASPEDQKLLDELTLSKQQLAKFTLQGPGREGGEAYQARLKALTEQADQAEASVSARSTKFKVQTQPITLEAVQQAIPKDGVLVEFASYRPLNAKAQRFETPHYVAYVLKPGSGSSTQSVEHKTPNPEIQWVDLGDVKTIDKAVADFLAVLRNPESPLGTLRSLKLSSIPQSRAVTVNAQARLMDQLVMQPVRRLAGPIKHLLISPDGSLNLIPFSALVDEQGKYLVEKYTLTYLTSGRDLLRLQTKLESQSPPLVLTDPDYGEGTGPQLGGQVFHSLTRLASTAQEGAKIQQLYPETILKKRKEATKQAILGLQSPQILHLATHGTFLPDVVTEEAVTSEPGLPLRLLEREADGNLEKIREANPLLRAALFFAGANGGTASSGDSILTALETAQLNLWGTKLVVLSACETGLGEVKKGDGVYGLRRALVLAGSESQVMSLWQVSDEGTKELMTNFYRRLKAGEGRSEALQNTQLEMVKNPKWRHPFYWAAFIQSGEWRPLNESH